MATSVRVAMEEGEKLEQGSLYDLLKEVFLLLDDGDRRFFNAFKLSIARYYALYHIGRQPGISPGVLSQLMLCDKSNITRIIQGLESDGLVERRPHESDRRIFCLHLTERGENVLAQAAAAHTAYNVWRFRHFNNGEGLCLHHDLAQLRARLQEALNVAPSTFDVQPELHFP